MNGIGNGKQDKVGKNNASAKAHKMKLKIHNKH